MKRLAKTLLRLYPKAWRERYGEELATLLDDSPPRAAALFDLLKGALRMQLAVPNFPRLALVLGGVGMLTGLTVSFAITPRYVSSAVLQVFYSSPLQANSLIPGVLVTRIQQEVLSRESLSGIIQDPRLDLYAKQRLRIPLEDVIEQMRRDVQMQIVGRPELPQDRYLAFEIRFSYSDPRKAQQTVQTFISKFHESNFQMKRAKNIAGNLVGSLESSELAQLKSRISVLEKRLGIQPVAPFELDSNRGVNLEDPIMQVLDTPSLPQLAAYPNRAMITATGFGIGIGLALIITIFRRRPQGIQPLPASMA